MVHDGSPSPGYIGFSFGTAVSTESALSHSDSEDLLLDRLDRLDRDRDGDSDHREGGSARTGASASRGSGGASVVSVTSALSSNLLDQVLRKPAKIS